MKPDWAIEALSAKRNGDYKRSIDLYTSHLDDTEDLGEVCFALGKSYYLAGDGQKSVAAYMSTMHLQLAAMPTLTRISPEIMELIRLGVQHGDHDEIRRLKETHPWTVVLFADCNTPRHCGHALVDLVMSERPDWFSEAYVDIYCSQLRGRLEREDTEREAQYAAEGRTFMHKRLIWEKLLDLDEESVLSAYGLVD